MAKDDEDRTSLGHGEVVAATDKALLVRLTETGDGEVWIPRSVIHDDSEVYEDEGSGTVVVKTWWAEKQGLA